MYTEKLAGHKYSQLNYDSELEYYDRLHHQKYRDKNQSKDEHRKLLAYNLASSENHRDDILEILRSDRFLPAGRIQAALGAKEREVSPFNCSVSGKIEDKISSIYLRVSQAAQILRLGTGIGYNFSHIRPHGALVSKLQTEASGPVSYMDLFDCSAKLIASSGHRRGAQMGILNVNHPDIEKFIDAKMEKGKLNSFNISVGVSDSFMEAVARDSSWNLVFNDKVYKTVSARELWGKILQNAYASGEPGLVFLDRMNHTNNLWYCEHIEATNPCSEQPLPPYGLCTLGSFNLTRYIDFYKDDHDTRSEIVFNYTQFKKDIHSIVEAYDNVFNDAIYAIPEHKEDALNKRRIGLGLTGIANAIEMMVGRPSYGEPEFNEYAVNIAKTLAVEAYTASVKLAKERGPFSLFDPDLYGQCKFIDNLPEQLQEDIRQHGIRNSHLISYAPCGTISQCAGNVSSGVEPVFYHEAKRTVLMQEGKREVTLTDWAYREHRFRGKTLEECTVDQHLAVGSIFQTWCDSAVSKTINVAPNCSYEEYKEVYDRAYSLGMKGITVFRPNDITGQGVISKAESKNEDVPANTSEFSTNFCASGVCER